MSQNKNQSSSYRSHKKTAESLSLLEKLDTVPALLTLVGNVITALFTGVLRSKDRKPSAGLYKYVTLTALRTFTRRMSVRQQHYLAEPTDDAYDAACKKRGQQPNSVILEDGTRAHWIGDPSAEKLVINFHGGGYVFPASPEMFEFMFQVVALLNKRPNAPKAACLFLSYDLAPGAIYPRQLQQASMLLNHVLHTLHKAPSNILLTGDSAGANLALALLSHISYPHPSTVLPIPKVQFEGKLRGAVLISPWVSFNMNDDSFRRNELKDCLGPKAGKQWSSAFLGCAWPHTSASDSYNQAITAPESWWKDLKVEEVLIVAGGEEVLVDGIKKFEKQFAKGFGEGNVEFRVVEGEYHDQPNIDLQFGYKESQEGGQAKVIKGWIGSKL